MKRFFKNVFKIMPPASEEKVKHLSMLLFFFCFIQTAFAQSIDLSLTESKTCATYTYCVTVGMKSTGGSGNQQIGNTSLLLKYDQTAVSYKNYSALNFDGSDLCNGGAATAWASHSYDSTSLSGKINLSLFLADNNFSCPVIDEMSVTDVAQVCFDILQQGASPNITFDSINCHINSDMPNNGTSEIAVGTFDSLFTAGAMLCDCTGAGTSCDDQNVYTVNDEYDANCNCSGTYADTDADGIYDGIDACIDTTYQAEDAPFASGNSQNSYGQYSGTGYINFWNSSNSFSEFSITPDSSGNHDLGFRYALLSDTGRMEIIIDGILQDTLIFPATGSWTDWDTIPYVYNFTPGAHIVRLDAISGQTGINLDGLRLSFCTSCTMSGMPCDDGDICTVSDVYDADCNCEGVYKDSDNDTVCDNSDICSGFDDLADADGDGTPDGCDTCDNTLIGTACDDGDACTVGDIYDSACNCAGTFSGTDTDGDGVCDAADICAGGDDNIDTDSDGTPDFCDSCNDLLIGLPCNDSDTCTILDRYDATCACAGIYIDSDGDGTCNILDLCEGFDDNIDTDGDGIPDGCDNCDNALIGTPCDDGDACTINDLYDTECNCIGTFQDTDGDGTCDSYDLCVSYHDSIDSDLDVIPDMCDTCYDFTTQEAGAYYVGARLRTYYKGYSGDGYLDFRNNTNDTIIYTIQVDVPGVYDVSLRYASWSNSRRLNIDIDGVREYTDYLFPNTSGWDRWDKVLFTKSFSTGTHTVRLTTDGNHGPNIDLISICLPGYQPEPRIASGNNEFEQDFTNWTQLRNWIQSPAEIEIETADSAIVCGNKSAYAKKSGVYEQLYTDLDYLIMGDTMVLHFYSKGGAADVYVGKPADVYTGTYYFKDKSSIDSAFVHDSVKFVVTEPVMRLWFDLYPNDSLYLDAFSFDNTNCLLNIQPKVFLEGPYDSSTNMMSDYLRTSGNFPLTEPYTGLNFQHVGRGGGEVIADSILNTNGNNAIVDWLMLELRDKNDSTLILSTRSALLQRDGDVVDTDGISPVTFSRMYADDFWFSVRHRNHLGIMVGDTLGLSPKIKTIDFNTLATFGSNAQKDVSGSNKALWSADIDNSKTIDGTDRTATWTARNSLMYEAADVTLDGKTDAADRAKTWNNRNKTEQVPD